MPAFMCSDASLRSTFTPQRFIWICFLFKVCRSLQPSTRPHWSVWFLDLCKTSCLISQELKSSGYVQWRLQNSLCLTCNADQLSVRQGLRVHLQILSNQPPSPLTSGMCLFCLPIQSGLGSGFHWWEQFPRGRKKRILMLFVQFLLLPHALYYVLDAKIKGQDFSRLLMPLQVFIIFLPKRIVIRHCLSVPDLKDDWSQSSWCCPTIESCHLIRAIEIAISLRAPAPDPPRITQ